MKPKYHGRSTSVANLMQQARHLSKAPGDHIWDKMNERFVRMYQRLTQRYERQRQHAIHLEQLLAEKNVLIRELHGRIEVLEQPDYFAK